MRVKMIKGRSDIRPAWLTAKLPEAQIFISEDKVYDVHAISVFEGKISLLVVDDLRMINWYPSWFFEISGSSLPDDWICNLFDGEPTMVVGPEFVVKDIASYCAMVELEDEQVQRFWRRLDTRNQRQDD